MEYKDLYGYVFLLVSVGMLIGVSLLVIDNFAEGVQEQNSVVNETIALSSQAGTVTNADEVVATFFGNGSASRKCTLPDPACANVTSAGAVTANSSFANGNYVISYSYYYDGEGTDTLQDVRDAVSPIASTWLGLITTVFALAIVLGIVMQSFSVQR